MKLYYRAVTQNGKTIRGIIDAKDVQEAAHYLRTHQLIPITIIPESQRGLAKFFPFLDRASNSDLIFFTRQLSSTLTSGLTLMQSLQIMQNQIQNKKMAEIVQNIILDVENGSTLSTAIEKSPQVFSPIYIALIRTAETSGLLDKTLLRLADNLEKEDKIKRTIRGALLYPVIVVVMMILVMIVMMIFVIPQLTSLYDNLSIDLPLTTQVVIGLSNIFVYDWPYVIIVSLLIGYFFKKWYQQDSGRHTVDKYLLRVPVFGKLLQETIMTEFTRTLGILISSGSLVVDSLIRSSDTVGNVIYKDAITLVAKRVEKGIDMGDAMEASHLFPAIVIEMVKIGEQTGKMDESLLRASEYFEREVDETVKTLTTLLEPAIMVILAVGVGFLIFAIITPIYNLLSSIQ